ncbi:MAG: 23S rRNA (guanosine(2251)-2'-O)-methyltransferase RlmB [Candidatus Planktophila sp.]|jgi:23S rRNA (guanosine2251-2'-O)-methyltransferase|nr:23S rRNA (guanosine(2251)-2'-O)-methyltransferase RlmB [Candidatus Planktophila sp.]MBP7903465.1 23S rRNA (guanosine(2251)-2'-O)-methyltransferase RlmB [Candidatus Planktophila sp.]
MAGNSKPRGAVRKSKKGPTVGSGGNRKRGLEGKGPTPKAEDRPYHAAHKAKKRAEKTAEKRPAAPRLPKSEMPKGEIVSGRNAVLEALRESVPATEIMVARGVDIDDRIAESLQLALNLGLQIKEVHRAQLETIAPNSQGIILGIKPFQYSSYEEICDRAKGAKLLVALDGVTDPRNLGAVTRSAAAFGASGIIIPERRAAALTASAWKTSAGAAARLPIAQVTNLARTIDDAKKRGMFIVGLDGDADVELSEMKVAKEDLMIIVGSEGKGLARLTREKCDLIVSIPISSATESLNASVATSITLFWIDEQRRKG